MQLVRTTIRVPEALKKAAERRASEENTTFQDILQRALRGYLNQSYQKKAKKLVFLTHDLGTPLDNLTRSDYYPEP